MSVSSEGRDDDDLGKKTNQTSIRLDSVTDVWD
jgi:hypothetical protein